MVMTVSEDSQDTKSSRKSPHPRSGTHGCKATTSDGKKVGHEKHRMPGKKGDQAGRELSSKRRPPPPPPLSGLLDEESKIRAKKRAKTKQSSTSPVILDGGSSMPSLATTATTEATEKELETRDGVRRSHGVWTRRGAWVPAKEVTGKAAEKLRTEGKRNSDKHRQRLEDKVRSFVRLSVCFRQCVSLC